MHQGILGLNLLINSLGASATKRVALFGHNFFLSTDFFNYANKPPDSECGVDVLRIAGVFVGHLP